MSRCRTRTSRRRTSACALGRIRQTSWRGPRSARARGKLLDSSPHNSHQDISTPANQHGLFVIHPHPCSSIINVHSSFPSVSGCGFFIHRLYVLRLIYHQNSKKNLDELMKTMGPRPPHSQAPRRLLLGFFFFGRAGSPRFLKGLSMEFRVPECVVPTILIFCAGNKTLLGPRSHRSDPYQC